MFKWPRGVSELKWTVDRHVANTHEAAHLRTNISPNGKISPISAPNSRKKPAILAIARQAFGELLACGTIEELCALFCAVIAINVVWAVRCLLCPIHAFQVQANYKNAQQQRRQHDESKMHDNSNNGQPEQPNQNRRMPPKTMSRFDRINAWCLSRDGSHTETTTKWIFLNC